MRALVCGSRSWAQPVLVYDRLQLLEPGTVVVHGACEQGADRMADWAADLLGLAVEPHPAEWPSYGRSAGHRRNAEMLATLARDTDRVIAFLSPSYSPGTRGMIRLAERGRYVLEVIEP